MLYVFPDYYKSFECISSDCRHSCCIGWEIDIDEKTYKRYSELDGEIGRRLRDNISSDGTPHFSLTQNGRCPFLNGRNLCDLILYGGEEMLCDICADHPRFRNFLPGRTEIGLGLCCEEAARLIIDSPAQMELIYEGRADERDDYSEALIQLRDELLGIAADSSVPYSERAAAVLSRCHVDLASRSPRNWAKLLLSLERMDEEWTGYLESLRDADTATFEYDSRSGRLLSYFLYRHLTGAYDDGNIQGRVLFAVFSVYIINLICAVCGRDRLYDIARLYSAEIEYSDENLRKLFDLI